jgi:hypothetical protein
LRGILKGLAEHQAVTDPKSEDGRLRGRTYAIPFEDVWQASLTLCGGGMRGWSVLSADDHRGVIEAVSKARLLGVEVDVRVDIRLDENAQTRVDVWSATQRSRASLGQNRRAIGKFFRRLDRTLDAPDKILDPTRALPWQDPR